MNEQIQLLRRYARMVWPYRWVALVLAVICAIGGTLYVFTLPPTYEVKAKIFVDTRSMLRPLMKGLAIDNTAIATSAMLMKRTLLTRPNIEKVARETDLDLETKTERDFENLINSLIENIKVSGTPRGGIYSISYNNRDPAKAKRVVDELLNTFLETALGSNRSDTVVAQKFLDEQIQEYEKRLIDAEERLRDFKQRNVGLMPGAGQNYYSRLQSAKGQLQQAELALSEAVKRRDELNRMLADSVKATEAGTAEASTGIQTQYSARIDAMERKLDDLLLQYTEKHTDILALQTTLASLKERHQAELADMAKQGGDSGNGVQSGGFHEVRLTLGEASAQAAALETRVAQYKARIEELDRLVDTVPEVEAELARLDRDYGLNKKRYRQLLDRRESARMSQEVDQKADNVKLKVIEPPRIPLSPTGPDRVTFISMTFLASLGIGAVVAFLLSQLNPRFYGAEELKEFAQLPILGAISLVSSRRQVTERRMEMAVFATVFLGFFALYGGLIALEGSEVDVHGRLVSVIGSSR